MMEQMRRSFEMPHFIFQINSFYVLGVFRTVKLRRKYGPGKFLQSSTVDCEDVQFSSILKKETKSAKYLCSMGIELPS